MNPIVKLIVSGLVRYLENHPDQVEALIQAAVEAIISELKGAKA